MFESAEIGRTIDKATFEAEEPALREALLEAQYELKQQARFPVIVLINGVEGAGKGETVKLLNEWMDPRLIQVSTFDIQTDEELARPPAWRYWRQLPPKGRMGVFFGNWYSQMLQGRVHGEFKDAVLDQSIDGAERLERMLCDEGALIFKFWFHLSKKHMKARLEALKEDPLHSWRISPLTGSNRRPTTSSCATASASCAAPAATTRPGTWSRASITTTAALPSGASCSKVCRRRWPIRSDRSCSHIRRPWSRVWTIAACWPVWT
jgi:polyphosphate kinase 2 (PPK2 family)